jgi:apolipoprotein N-acyltransferase
MALKTACLWAAGAVIAFHLAYAFSNLGFCILGYLFCLLQLTRVSPGRWSFYLGLGVGLLTVAPQLTCFWVIFQGGAVALWIVLAFWIALFVAVARLSRIHLGVVPAAFLAPLIWTGLEYFRSELYYLRFSWLNAGYVLPQTSFLPLCHWLGMYGAGFLFMSIASLVSNLRPRRGALMALRLGILIIVALFFQAFRASEHPASAQSREAIVAGAQLEFPSEPEALLALDKLIQLEPKAELLVLSEYTFLGPVPEAIRKWCRSHHRYLIVGGEKPAANSAYYNTAFVIGPEGDTVFQQGKSVPIQFFKDGLPTRSQQLWNSPWGRIGICICYDLSYTRVTDRLIRLGAQALIVPTMDVADWGRHQHALHARVAPVRAAEYAVPIFRVASSGVSQLIDKFGHVSASAGFPGPGAILGGPFSLAEPGSLPLDRWLSPFSTGVTGVLMVWFLVQAWLLRRRPAMVSRMADL